jgi:hypothetical protein
MLPSHINSPLAYAKEQFEKYHLIAPPSQSEKYNFSWGKTAKQMKAEYEYALQQWAIEKYGSRKETSEKTRRKRKNAQ